ncbi:hypothetical protein D3C71_1640100 [compost metagenome]
MNAALTEMVHLHHFQGGLDPTGSLRTADLAQTQGISNVFCNGHMREQRIVLKHHADIPFMWRTIQKLYAIDLDASRVRANEAGQHIEQGRFPRP